MSGSRVSGFEGTAGKVAGAVMARFNRDMEVAAVAELGPGDADTVLAVGFGPGVGIAELAARLRHGVVAGIDPSATMVEQATRRNREAIGQGRVCLRRAGAESIPWPDAAFDGVLAVNSLQLWEPLDVSLHEVARVLSPGGTLVALTHTWAIEKRATVAEWSAAVSTLLRVGGMVEVSDRTDTFRSGQGLVLRARKPLQRTPAGAQPARPVAPTDLGPAD